MVQATPDQIKRGLARLDDRITELKAFDVRVLTNVPSPALRALGAAIEDTLERCFGNGTSALCASTLHAICSPR